MKECCLFLALDPKNQKQGTRQLLAAARTTTITTGPSVHHQRKG